MTPHRHFARKRTRADRAAALMQVLVLRTRPYSPTDIASMARIHATSAEDIKARLREMGRGGLIEGEGW